MKRLLLIALLCSTPMLAACPKAPPNVTPVGQAAITATHVIQALDVIRDLAVSLNAQQPPVLSTAVTTKIVTFHESAVKVILAAPSGWKQTVLAGLDQLQTDLVPADWNRIAPYVALVKGLIAAVA